MVHGLLNLRLVTCAFAVCVAVARGEQTLDAAFRAPPDDAPRPSVKLALEDLSQDKAALFQQLSRLREVGAGGLLLRVPTANDDVWARLAQVSDACRRLGLELGVCDFALSPEEAAARPRAQRLVWSATQPDVQGPETSAQACVFQPGPSYREVARLAVPAVGEVLPHQVVDVKTAPVPTNGAWRVFGFGCSDVEPPQADCFDGDGVFRHVNQLLDGCQTRLARTYGTTLTWCQMAGPGRSDLLWPRDLPEAFLKQSGLNLMRHLPAVAGVNVGGESTSAYVRSMVAQVVRELWRQRFADHVNELVHEAGLEAGVGVGEAPIDPEEIALYFMRPTLTSARTPQQEATNVRAAGGARAWGRKFVVGDVACATAFAAQVPESQPFPCKGEIDRLLGSGATRILFAVSGGVPEEGERFAQLRAVCRYAQRCQVLLQCGEPVADFLVWSDGVPSPLAGYSCDFANLTMLRTAVVKEGKVQFESDRAYASLAVTADVLREKAAEKKVKQLAADGVTVWLVSGGRPDEEALLSRLADGGACKRWQAAGEAAPIAPDLQWRSESAGLQIRFLHRRTADYEIYFVVNVGDAGGPATFVFRDVGKGSPQRWSPLRGEVEPSLQVTRLSDGREAVSVPCVPNDAFFVVFSR